jgi:hypothetical protein
MVALRQMRSLEQLHRTAVREAMRSILSIRSYVNVTTQLQEAIETMPIPPGLKKEEPKE